VAFDQREGGAAHNPYADVMGRSFVEIAETGPITVLDDRRCEILSAWVARVIPGDRVDWPSAAELDTVAYIDAVIAKAPTLRPVVLGGIDAVDRAARADHDRQFTDLPAPAQVAVLQLAESSLSTEAFSVILELTYEAYYRAPRVQQIVKDRTGFDVANTVGGKPMKQFPVERLRTVSSRSDRYREVPHE
jgi:hypothetical protein